MPKTYPLCFSTIGGSIVPHLLTNCHFFYSPFSQFVDLQASNLNNLPFCQFAILSTCYSVSLPPGQLVPFCQLAILLTYCFVNLPFCQLVILSTYCFVNLSFCQLAVLSTCHFVNIQFITRSVLPIV